jgi:hypothetical protein
VCSSDLDAINAKDGGVRNLPKLAWIAIILFFPLIGSIAWLIAGRPSRDVPLTRSQGAAPGFPEYERRGRFAATSPDDDEEFLRKVRERAEEQRRRYEAERRRKAQEDPDA